MSQLQMGKGDFSKEGTDMAYDRQVHEGVEHH
jgi:hypothetical protein